MFEFLSVFGPAAVTWLTVCRLTKKTAVNYFHAALELIAYAALNVLVMILFLLPFDKVELVIMPNGLRGLRYGGTAYILSFAAAFILAIIISFVKKRFDIGLEISPKTKELSGTDPEGCTKIKELSGIKPEISPKAKERSDEM